MSETDELPREDRPDQLLDRWQNSKDSEALRSLLIFEISMIKKHLKSRKPRWVNNSNSASEVAQDVALKILGRHDRLPRFDTVEGMRKYLMVVAWNLCRERFRQAARAPLLLGSQASDALLEDPTTTGGIKKVEREEFQSLLQLALNLLPDTNQRVLRACVLEGKGAEEVAVELGLPSSAAVRMRKKRALENLNKELRRLCSAIDSE